MVILDDLPLTAFLETAAHEYAHHWQIQGNPELHDLAAIEGFAQWTASQWLIRNKLYSSNARLAQAPGPIYGDGYRTIKQYADINGSAVLLRDILRMRGGRVDLDKPLSNNDSAAVPSPSPSMAVATPALTSHRFAAGDRSVEAVNRA